MSYFTVDCAWCGERYTTGIVGRSPVGSGHACEVVKPCDRKGCENPASFCVERGVGGVSFCCGSHLAGRTIVGVQPLRAAS